MAARRMVYWNGLQRGFGACQTNGHIRNPVGVWWRENLGYYLCHAAWCAQDKCEVQTGPPEEV